MKIENSDLLLFVPIRHLKLWDASTITNTIGSTNRAVHREFFGPTWSAAHSCCVAVWRCVSCDFCGGCDCHDRRYVYGYDGIIWARACAVVMGGKSIVGSAISVGTFTTALQTGAQNNIVVCQKRACGDVADNDFCNGGISST